MKLAIIILAVLVICGTYLTFANDGNKVGTDVTISDIFDYLRANKGITVKKLSYDNKSQTAQTLILLDSNTPGKLTEFLDLVEQQAKTSDYELVISKMKGFTPDYRIELACNLPATLEFVFFEDTNAVCLRSEDYYFFAEFSTESALPVMEYLNKLRP